MTRPAAPGTPASSAQAAAIELLDSQLSLLWRRARSINHQLTRSVHPDLEPAAYGLLSVLMRHGGMRLTELAQRIAVGKPSVSRQITFLVSLGLVARESDPLDGRAQLIQLTPAGLAKMNSLHAGRQLAFQQQLAEWDEEELTQLARLVEKLNADFRR